MASSSVLTADVHSDKMLDRQRRQLHPSPGNGAFEATDRPPSAPAPIVPSVFAKVSTLRRPASSNQPVQRDQPMEVSRPAARLTSVHSVTAVKGNLPESPEAPERKTTVRPAAVKLEAGGGGGLSGRSTSSSDFSELPQRSTEYSSVASSNSAHDEPRTNISPVRAEALVRASASATNQDQQLLDGALKAGRFLSSTTTTTANVSFSTRHPFTRRRRSGSGSSSSSTATISLTSPPPAESSWTSTPPRQKPHLGSSIQSILVRRDSDQKKPISPPPPPPIPAPTPPPPSLPPSVSPKKEVNDADARWDASRGMRRMSASRDASRPQGRGGLGAQGGRPVRPSSAPAGGRRLYQVRRGGGVRGGGGGLISGRGEAVKEDSEPRVSPRPRTPPSSQALSTRLQKSKPVEERGRSRSKSPSLHMNAKALSEWIAGASKGATSLVEKALEVLNETDCPQASAAQIHRVLTMPLPFYARPPVPRSTNLATVRTLKLVAADLRMLREIAKARLQRLAGEVNSMRDAVRKTKIRIGKEEGAAFRLKKLRWDLTVERRRRKRLLHQGVYTLGRLQEYKSDRERRLKEEVEFCHRHAHSCIFTNKIEAAFATGDFLSHRNLKLAVASLHRQIDGLARSIDRVRVKRRILEVSSGQRAKSSHRRGQQTHGIVRMLPADGSRSPTPFNLSGVSLSDTSRDNRPSSRRPMEEESLTREELLRMEDEIRRNEVRERDLFQELQAIQKRINKKRGEVTIAVEKQRRKEVMHNDFHLQESFMVPQEAPRGRKRSKVGAGRRQLSTGKEAGNWRRIDGLTFLTEVC